MFSCDAVHFHLPASGLAQETSLLLKIDMSLGLGLREALQAFVVNGLVLFRRNDRLEVVPKMPGMNFNATSSVPVGIALRAQQEKVPVGIRVLAQRETPAALPIGLLALSRPVKKRKRNQELDSVETRPPSHVVQPREPQYPPPWWPSVSLQKVVVATCGWKRCYDVLGY